MGEKSEVWEKRRTVMSRSRRKVECPEMGREDKNKTGKPEKKKRTTPVDGVDEDKGK